MRVFYLVHDLGDAAVKRRVQLLDDGGASVVLAGFHRLAAGVTPTAEGLAIGVTRNGRLAQRAVAAARAVLGSRRWREGLEQADVIVARNLEMLAVAVMVRRQAGSVAPIVYECLDIHRLLTRHGPAGATLRQIERRLLASTSLLWTSSSAFIAAHFDRRYEQLPPCLVLENKMLASELFGCAEQQPFPPAAPPWRIGWFGVIRCRKSLEVLARLVDDSNGLVEVEIRGRPARDVLGDFDRVVGRTEGLTYGGPYDRATELASLYGRVHFNWAIDFYEQGENSAWLLPNRLYEGSVFGAVPIALADVETGHWLQRRGCGVLLQEPLEDALRGFFKDLTVAAYDDARNGVLSIRRSDLVEARESGAALVGRLEELAPVQTGAARPLRLDQAA